jgi:ketosteroid isomerase-like protein
MSEENLEIVRELFDAFDRRDHEAAFEYYDADIEWDASRAADGGASDVAGVYHGTRASGSTGADGCRPGRTSKPPTSSSRTRVRPWLL